MSSTPQQPGLKQSGLIHGLLYDAQGRCVHYHSPLDVLGNLCGQCQKYYACFQCHAALCTHPFTQIPRSHPAGLCCGVCQATFSYTQYAQCGQQASSTDSQQESFAPACPHCGAAMNPGCQIHSHLYYLPEN